MRQGRPRGGEDAEIVRLVHRYLFPWEKVGGGGINTRLRMHTSGKVVTDENTRAMRELAPERLAGVRGLQGSAEPGTLPGDSALPGWEGEPARM